MEQRSFAVVLFHTYSYTFAQICPITSRPVTKKKQKKMAGRSGSTIMESSAETRANLFRRVFKSSLTALDTNSFVELLGIELGIDLSGT